MVGGFCLVFSYRATSERKTMVRLLVRRGGGGGVQVRATDDKQEAVVMRKKVENRAEKGLHLIYRDGKGVVVQAQVGIWLVQQDEVICERPFQNKINYNLNLNSFRFESAGILQLPVTDTFMSQTV